MNEYSSQSVYRIISDALNKKELMKYERGIYYLPKEMEFGLAVPSVERVITKKYLRDGDEVFGIYGRWIMELNFDLSTQVPNTIEIITNKASRAIKEIEMRGRRVIIRKSRLPITKDNVYAYTLLELFNMMDMNEYSKRVQRCVLEYIKEKKINKDSVMKIAYAFPSKAMQKVVISGVIYQLI